MLRSQAALCCLLIKKDVSNAADVMQGLGSWYGSSYDAYLLYDGTVPYEALNNGYWNVEFFAFSHGKASTQDMACISNPINPSSR